MSRRLEGAVVALAVAVAVVAPSLPATAVPGSVAPARVVRWVDGDTVVTTAGRIRLIGVDTPERGTCGFQRARRLAARLAPAGTRIRVVDPRSVQDHDAYGRLLRYVDRGRVDLALRQIQAGAKARYDGLDGYDRHPRQARYRAADTATPDRCPAPTETTPTTPTTPTAGVDLASYAPVPGTRDCPANAPIKGNQTEPEWIYHLPGNRYYAVTSPEECFATEAAALARGYRAAKV